MQQLVLLFRYPVKSMQGEMLENTAVHRSGFIYDRVFMVTTPDGGFVTARTNPNLLLLKPELKNEGLLIKAREGKEIIANYVDFSKSHESTQVWGNTFTSHIASIAVNRWLSDYIGYDVQLRWLGEQTTRRIKKYPHIPLSFSDTYPFLLFNQASFDYLQQRCPIPLSIERFRPNIVITGSDPFEEDGWKTIQIGDVIFEIVKPCSRCILTTVDPITAQMDNAQEPLTTLQTFRTDSHQEIDLGMNMIALTEGEIKIGDSVSILETRTPKLYFSVNSSMQKQKKRTVEKENKQINLIVDDNCHNGNTQQVLLEQLEFYGYKIPYSCRSGVCGLCKIKLRQGNITPLTATAILPNNYVLSCSCVANGDISLSTHKSEK